MNRFLQSIENKLFNLYLKSDNGKWYDPILYRIWAKSFDLTV